MNRINKLREFLINKLHSFEFDSAGGAIINEAPFEVLPRDYLSFAEEELLFMKVNNQPESIKHNINCISNLKRAMDSQMDVFFYITQLNSLSRKNSLKIKNKLEFLENSGIFKSTSLSRLTKIRNKIEHDYSIPNVQDIEIYFDLISAFISVMEASITQLSILSEIDFFFESEDSNHVSVSMKYISGDIPSISLKIKEKDNEDVTIVKAEDYLVFSYFFRALLLLGKLYGVNNESSRKFTISELMYQPITSN